MATALYTAQEANPTTKRQRYELQRSALMSERQGGGFDATWRDLADYFSPRRPRFQLSDRNRGDRRNQNIIDSTGRFAARTLSSGLHAGLTSPARPWMKLSTPDPALAEFGPVKKWLHTVTHRMLVLFGQTNLYNVLPTTYQDMGVFGTAAMATLSDSRDLFRAYSYPIGSYALACNNRGLVNTFYREYEMSVQQAVEEFGVRPGMRDIDWTKFSPRIKNLWDRSQYYEAVHVGWLVQPNHDINPRSFDANKRLPFTSCHFEIDMPGGGQGDYYTSLRDNRFLRESGFRTFPVLAPRWDVTGEDSYGTDSPGIMVLGDNRQLQVEQRKKGQLLAKAVDPPLKGPTSLRTQKTSLVQGDITYVDVREGQQGLSPIHEVRLEGFQHLVQDLQEVQTRIDRAFFVDLFLMIARSDAMGSPQKTAREIEERHEEKLLALGPVLERTNDELLDPLVDRTYSMMEDAGMIPDVPQELDNVQLRVEYISIMAQAQKLVGVVGQDRFMQSVAPLVAVWPEARHKVKVFQIVTDYGDMLGVNPNQIRDDEEAQQLSDMEAQAQQQAMQAKQMQQVATGAAAAGKEPVAEGSVLDQMLGNGLGSGQGAAAGI